MKQIMQLNMLFCLLLIGWKVFWRVLNRYSQKQE